MRVPFIDLRRQYDVLRAEIHSAIQRVLDSERFILGPEVEAFEGEISRFLGVKQAVAVASGTDALTLSLRGCGVGDGDVVVTTPFTFFATVGAICNLGARPLFVDIDETTYNIEPSKIEKAIRRSDRRKRIRAILPVHLYGQACEMRPIMEVAERYGLAVVEDASQAIGAQVNGSKVGTIGTTGCFSFYPTKNLSAFGDGGLISTNDEKLAERVRMLRQHGAVHGYYHELVGYNSRLDAIQAAVLRVKLTHLEHWIQKRRGIARAYTKQLANVDGIHAPGVPGRNAHVFNVYTIRVHARKRDDMIRFLESHGVETKVYYPTPVHLQPALSHLRYREGSMPNAERSSREVISLPMFPELTHAEQRHVLQAVKAYAR